MRFDSYHPALLLVFFLVAVGCALAWSHPMYIAISFAAATLLAAKLRGARGLLLSATLAVAALAYALWFVSYNHFGVTVLFRTFIGNSMTVESAAFGAAQGFMVTSALLWLTSFSLVMTTDKVEYLLGAACPRLALLVSIAVRSASVACEYRRRIAQARSGVGRGPGQGPLIRRPRQCLFRASALVDCMIGHFALASDSSRSRGGALRGRTAFAIFRFDNRDRMLAIVLAVLATISFSGAALDQTRALFDPVIVLNPLNLAGVLFAASYAGFCLIPVVLQVWGEWRFARMRKVRISRER